MYRVIRMIILAIALYASLMVSHVACSNSSGNRARAAGTNNTVYGNTSGKEISEAAVEDYENEFGPDGTQIWIHGAIGDPQKISRMNASGGRCMLDLRTWDAPSVSKILKEYAQLDLGICVTLRWYDPNNVAHDIPPTPQEAEEKLNQLMEVLTSAEAKALAGKFWVGFYGEIVGAGRFDYEDMDAMFEFATKAAIRIRKEAPYILISGPALITVQDLYKDPSRLRGLRKERYEIRQRSIRWSAEFADAIDLHLHTDSAKTARSKLKTLREFLDKEPGGRNTAIIVAEWSPVHFPNREDTPAVRQTMIDIWKAMTEAKVLFAAYACMYPEKRFGDRFGWQALFNNSGGPNEPFNKTFKEIGKGMYGNGSGDNSGSDDGKVSEGGDDVAGKTPPLWVAGGLGSPDRLVSLGAAGGRGIVDLRNTTGAEIAGHARDFRRSDLDLCITLRWSDPRGSGEMDTVPPAHEAQPIINSLIRSLKSKDSRELGERFWIQILNEVAGDVGRIRLEDADKIFNFSTMLAQRIRKEAPYIKICGPALTDPELFDLDNPSKAQQDKIDIMNRAIRWSIENADAIDVHIPATGDYNTAKTIIEQARSAVDAQPGGTSLPLVCWQFNASKFAGDQDDLNDVRTAIYNVWRAVAESSIIKAAFSTYSPRNNDIWTTLVDKRDKPNEPFYSTFMKMAKGDLGNGGSDIDSNDDSELKESLQKRRIKTPRRRRR